MEENSPSWILVLAELSDLNLPRLRDSRRLVANIAAYANLEDLNKLQTRHSGLFLAPLFANPNNNTIVHCFD
jgi:hypothetical protein